MGKKFFKIDSFTSEKIKERFIPELDLTVQYGDLTMEDVAAILQAKDETEQALTVLWKMLEKADPNVTLEKVKALPITVLVYLLRELADKAVREATNIILSKNAGLVS